MQNPCDICQEFECHSQSVWRTKDMAYEICPHCGAKMDGGADDE